MKNRIGIRGKLLLLSVAVLAIPYAGMEYLRELERHLRETLQVALMDAARAVAGPLHDRAGLFPEDPEPPERTLYVHSLAQPVQLDGYTDDWLSYISWSATYGDSPEPSFRFIVTRQEPYYYALLQVRDDTLILQRPDTPDALDNDHVVLVLTAPDGRLHRYYFSPAAPGRLGAFEFEVRLDEFGFENRVTRYVSMLNGEFQPGEGGYTMELAIPTYMVGSRLGVVVADVDDPVSRRVEKRVGTAGPETLDVPGNILEPSREILAMIRRFAEEPGRRIWVLDAQGRVLASAGGLEKVLPGVTAPLFYRLILPPPQELITDDLAGVSRLGGAEVRSALAGQVDSRWRSSPDGRAVIVSAAAPVFLGETVQGAVVVEETTGGIQMVQRAAMISLFNKTVLVFLVVTGAVLAFATRLSWRLRRLSRDADAAIDSQGRVVGGFRPSDAGDEIGELSRTYAALLGRLEEYNRYLEGLAARLTHELRTPITVVRTSLEQIPGDADGEPWLARAREGVSRLGLIVTRLGEAARLEQALQQSERVEVDVVDLLSRCVEGWRLAYSGVELRLSVPGAPLRAQLAPDLFEQMMEKLLANAVDFHEPGTPIGIALEAGPAEWSVSVTNRGPALPRDMEGRLFDSMVSVRDKRSAGDGPHLGLGLYIVRLIAAYHGAAARADNAAEGSVRFTVTFPR